MINLLELLGGPRRYILGVGPPPGPARAPSRPAQDNTRSSAAPDSSGGGGSSGGRHPGDDNGGSTPTPIPRGSEPR